jgi:hypothetical protein
MVLGVTFAEAGTTWNNYLYFPTAKTPLTSFSFQQTNFNISSGQPYDGTGSGLKSPTLADAYVIIKAGRHATSGPASWFINQVGPGQMIGCQAAAGSKPPALNFAAIGNMTLQVGGSPPVTCYDVVLGQGNVSGKNNWWIGGPHMFNANQQQLQQACQTPNGYTTVYFTADNACVSFFQLSPP